MPKYDVNAPDGKVYTVNAPDGATEAEAIQYVQKNLYKTGDSTTAGERFGKGLRDPIDGGAQLLTKMLPDGLVQAGNRLNNFIADKTGLVGKLPEGGVDQQVREGEQAYQQKRGAEAGFDPMRMMGNVLNPANLAIASRIPAAAGLAGGMVTGAVGGAASAALSPVANGDFASEKAWQLLEGAGGGAVMAPVAGAISRIVSPNASTNQNVQLLRREGVRPTLGQSLGGFANTLEEKAMSIPVLGDAIANARRGAANELNTAAFNRALAPVGQRLPAGVAGRDAVQFTDDAISAGYNQLLPRLTAQVDQPFATNLGNLRQMVQTGAIDPRAATSFERILQNDVLSKFGGNNQAMTGETFKRVESDLTNQINRMAISTDADQRLVGNALQQVRDELRGVLMRSNPASAAELNTLNRAWANFKRPQKAAAALGAEEGVFSPAQLQNAVKAADRSKDKARFAEGNALMQDLSEAGKSVLGNKVPNSGTADRLLLGGGALGGSSLVSPAIPISLLGAAAMYTRPMQALLGGAVSARPQSAQAVAQALRQASPMLSPLGAQIGLGLLN